MASGKEIWQSKSVGVENDKKDMLLLFLERSHHEFTFNNAY